MLGAGLCRNANYAMFALAFTAMIALASTPTMITYRPLDGVCDVGMHALTATGLDVRGVDGERALL